jgi:glycine/D-amino acid oxidase-like deaminating enzyme
LPATSDLATGLWGRPQLDIGNGGPAKGFLAGRPLDEWDVEIDGGRLLTESAVEHIRAGARQRWPGLSEAAFIEGRFGSDLYGNAELQPSYPADGGSVVTAFGWSGDGFKLGPAAGVRAAHIALEWLADR